MRLIGEKIADLAVLCRSPRFSCSSIVCHPSQCVTPIHPFVTPILKYCLTLLFTHPPFCHPYSKVLCHSTPLLSLPYRRIHPLLPSLDPFSLSQNLTSPCLISELCSYLTANNVNEGKLSREKEKSKEQ